MTTSKRGIEVRKKSCGNSVLYLLLFRENVRICITFCDFSNKRRKTQPLIQIFYRWSKQKQTYLLFYVIELTKRFDEIVSKFANLFITYRVTYRGAYITYAHG